MAIVTYQFANFGSCTLEFDVNTANYRMSQLRCINNSDKPAWGRILENDVEIFSAIAPANQTTSWNTTGIQLIWDSVDQNINLGPYVLQARWPN